MFWNRLVWERLEAETELRSDCDSPVVVGTERVRFQKHYHKGREICRNFRHVTDDVEVFFRPVGFFLPVTSHLCVPGHEASLQRLCS